MLDLNWTCCLTTFLQLLDNFLAYLLKLSHYNIEKNAKSHKQKLEKLSQLKMQSNQSSIFDLNTELQLPEATS